MANVLELLAKRLEEDGINFELDTLDEPTLNITFDSIGEKEEGVIGMNITKVAMEDAEKYEYYHFFSAIALNIDAESIIPIVRRINAFNLDVILGSYGIVEEGGLLYHKYVTKVNANFDSVVDDLYAALIDVLAEIDADYERVTETVE